MRDSTEASWYELRPNGMLAISVANPRRYTDLPAAEEAAVALRRRMPDVRFIEIVLVEFRDGDRAAATPVARV
jgi:hypothetical protein